MALSRRFLVYVMEASLAVLQPLVSHRTNIHENMENIRLEDPDTWHWYTSVMHLCRSLSSVVRNHLDSDEESQIELADLGTPPELENFEWFNFDD
jgi:hypothetical protein